MKMLSNAEDAKKLVNTPMDQEGLMYIIHIVAIGAKDVDLDRKLSILTKNGADIKHRYGANGFTVAHLLCMRKNPTFVSALPKIQTFWQFWDFWV